MSESADSGGAEPAVPAAPAVLAAPARSVILRTEGITKRFRTGKRKVRALRGIDMQVEKGEFVSIMGPSGSGKTTLLTILGCLDKPTEGKMFLDGEDITAVPESELCNIRRRKIGFVFQTFNLIPYLNALENVELPMETLEPDAKKRTAKAEELLKLVGLKKRMTHRPNKLSAGEQQRVAIARALANDPAIILADEPTGNLDSRTKQKIMRLLALLNVERGMTIILVTHDTGVCNRTDRMLWISDGKLLKKEKKGMNLVRKKLMCPQCHADIRPADERCPKCNMKLAAAPAPAKQVPELDEEDKEEDEPEDDEDEDEDDEEDDDEEEDDDKEKA
jgi:putative ABC transport system ATP-binding protein